MKKTLQQRCDTYEFNWTRYGEDDNEYPATTLVFYTYEFEKGYSSTWDDQGEDASAEVTIHFTEGDELDADAMTDAENEIEQMILEDEGNCY